MRRSIQATALAAALGSWLLVFGGNAASAFPAPTEKAVPPEPMASAPPHQGQIPPSEDDVPDGGRQPQAGDSELKKAKIKRFNWALVDVDAQEGAYQRGNKTIGELIAAHGRLLEADLALANAAADRVTALSRALERAQELEGRGKALYRERRTGGELDKLTEIRAWRLEVQVRLLEAKETR